MQSVIYEYFETYLETTVTNTNEVHDEIILIYTSHSHWCTSNDTSNSESWQYLFALSPSHLLRIRLLLLNNTIPY
jgi:hypothetical protein